MSELTVREDAELIVDMTAEEAEQAANTFVAHGKALRSLLLEMYERQAHKALKFPNWETFCQQRLGLHSDKSYLSHTLDWARAERNVFGRESCKNYNFIPQASTYNPPKLPFTTAMELAKLKVPNLQKQAYEEMQVMRENGYGTEKNYLYGLKKTVKRLLSHEAPPAAKTAPPPENKFDTDAAGKPAPAAPKEDKPKPPVTTFTPPADPEPELELPASLPDFEEVKVAMDTAYTWVQNQEIDGNPKTRAWAVKLLRELADWIEAQR